MNLQIAKALWQRIGVLLNLVSVFGLRKLKRKYNMALNGKKVAFGGGNKGPQQAAIEGGTYPARVVQVLDLGLQPQRPYQGEEKPPAHEIMITYEFLDEFCLDDDGNELEDKPRWLSETMPLRSLQSDLAKSTKRYNALDPNDDLDGDFLGLVNIPCMVTITATPDKKGKKDDNGNTKVYNNISVVSTMRPKEAAKAPELVNPSKTFELEEPDVEVLGSLPPWLQDKIKDNLEFAGSNLEAALNGGKVEKPKEEPKTEEAEDDGEW